MPAGESALDGARRELREETGVEADGWREIVRFHLSNSISDEAGVLFAARARSMAMPTRIRPRSSRSAGCRSTRRWR